MSTSNLKARQRQLREDAILDATQELLNRKGFFELNMDEVAAQVGIAKATLYQHFPSKEELVIQVVVRLLRRSEEAFDKLDPQLPALQRLALFLKRGIAYRASMWEANQHAANSAQLPPKVQDAPAYQEQLAQMKAKLARLVDEAKGEGTIKQEFSTPIIVALISRLFQNNYAELLAAQLCTPQELSETIVEIILAGIRS